MKMKNDCEHDCIKEAFDKLYNCVMPYIDLNEFANADMAFKELDKKVHSEIYILKKCLSERDRAVDAGITRSKVLQERISDLENELNNKRKHGEDLADVNCQLASENAGLKARLTLWEHSRITWRGRAQHAEKEVEDLNKRISDLEKENADLRITPFDTLEALKKENKKLAAACEDNKRLREIIDGKEKEINSLKKKIHELEQETADDAIRIKSLERANSVLRGDNKILWSKLEEADIPEHHKCPWHGDVNAMTDERTCHKSLVETIEELNAKKARLEENVDLSPGHEFEFGDEVFVPWSCDPYMYIKSGQLYNPRTDKLVYVGKDQHLKWFGEKFAIV